MANTLFGRRLKWLCQPVLETLQRGTVRAGRDQVILFSKKERCPYHVSMCSIAPNCPNLYTCDAMGRIVGLERG